MVRVVQAVLVVRTCDPGGQGGTGGTGDPGG